MSTIQAEASKPQKKMRECNRCKGAGFTGQMISFERIGVDPATGRIRWKLIDDNGKEHVHKVRAEDETQNNAGYFKRKRVVNLAAVADVSEAKRLLSLGWEYKTSYPATVASVPHYILVKRE